MRLWAITVFLALGFVGSLFYFVNWGIFSAGQNFAKLIWSFGILALLTGITGTRLGLPFYLAWMAFVYAVSSLIGYAALTLVFLLVVTPLALVGRLLGRDKLQLSSNKVVSFWHVLPSHNNHNPERLF
jgi:hypothetical protein